MTAMPALVTPTGRFDRLAIMEAARALYATKQAFINQYQGKPRAFWQKRCWQDAFKSAWRTARTLRHQMIWARLNVTYRPSEVKRLASLDAYAHRQPINEVGNQIMRETNAKAAVIRERAHRRAYRKAKRELFAGALVTISAPPSAPVELGQFTTPERVSHQ